MKFLNYEQTVKIRSYRSESKKKLLISCPGKPIRPAPVKILQVRKEAKVDG